jgi:hypothetical protein
MRLFLDASDAHSQAAGQFGEFPTNFRPSSLNLNQNLRTIFKDVVEREFHRAPVC